MRLIATYLIGLIFGVGISISGMANPAKVLNFFDIAGTWDPSLIFVMGGALVTTFIGYKIVFGRSAPIFEGGSACQPTARSTHALIGGSAVFGIGWGIAGFLPGRGAARAWYRPVGGFRRRPDRGIFSPSSSISRPAHRAAS
jgi:uncharacterized membrane protein YedE/YeeE